MIAATFGTQNMAVRYGQGEDLWGLVIEADNQRLNLTTEQAWALYGFLNMVKDRAFES